jgi:hypothetical protein
MFHLTRLWNDYCFIRPSQEVDEDKEMSVRITLPTSFPVYSASICEINDNSADVSNVCVAIAGGSSASSFIGVPVHVISLTRTLSSAIA